MQLKQIKHSLNCVLHPQYKYCILVAQMFFPQKQYLDRKVNFNSRDKGAVEQRNKLL